MHHCDRLCLLNVSANPALDVHTTDLTILLQPSITRRGAGATYKFFNGPALGEYKAVTAILQTRAHMAAAGPIFQHRSAYQLIS